MTRVLICGGRDADPEKVAGWLAANIYTVLIDHKISATLDAIIHGAARGTDTGAHLFAFTISDWVDELAFPANWGRYGLGAGPIRNRQMLIEGKPDVVIAFPGKTGTANMIKQAEAAGVPVIRVEGDFSS